MTKREKQIYKSGRKNPNGYSFSPLNIFNNKLIPLLIIFLILFSVIFEILDKTGVVSWNRLLSVIGIVDGVERQDSDFAVYYLDVGQSDCTVIICDDEVLLIDLGTVNQIHNIRESLFSLEISEIDYMIVTHQHDDHMAGASEIMKHYTVSNIMMPKLSKINSVDSLTYQDLINNIAENNVNPVAVSSGYSFMLGSALVEVLSPLQQDENLNNMSVVLKITYGDTSFLFQGDSEKEIEKQLLNSGMNLKANVLKIGHHGSDTSSQSNYLKAVNPDYAVVSCGTDNTYGHPNSNVIDRLEDNGIKPYITSLDGNITAISDGKSITIITEK